MADELVDALQEVKVGFGLHVERRGAKCGRVQPGPGLGGGDVAAEEVSGGGGPARVREFAPHVDGGLAFAFGQVRVAVAGKRDGRIAVALRAQQRAVLACPGVHRLQEALVRQFGQRPAPVVADGRGVRAGVADQRGQVRREIVTAARCETGPANRASSRIRRLPGCRRRRRKADGAEGLQQPVADGVQMGVEGLLRCSDRARSLPRRSPGV